MIAERGTEARLRRLDWTRKKRILFLASLFLLGLGLRAYHLDRSGLSEDETHKLFAVRSYDHGDFAVNAEHPMLMKMLCFASLHSAAFWNGSAGRALDLNLSEETALRLPNAIFGALTVIPLCLLGEALFGFRVAAITSLLWALGLNAVWFNRTAKEDTLMVFFTLLGYYLYTLAKSQAPEETDRQARLYGFGGAAFGLMVASKYFPHYIGLNALFFHLVGRDSRNNRPLTARFLKWYFAGMALAFSIFNFGIFMPATWRYLWKYLKEDLQTHHGYLIMGKLFFNDMTQTPGGNPWYFYGLYLLVKLPLPVLAAFIVGLIEIFRRRRTDYTSRGYLFLRMQLIFWLLPMSIIGAKFLRYSLALIPLVYMTAAVGTVLILRTARSVIERLAKWKPHASGMEWERAGHRARLSHRTRWLTSPMLTALSVGVIFVGLPAATSLASLPFPSLYTNPMGGRRAGYFFPHDEFYDLGARESVAYIAANAPKGTMVASEAPGVLQYYLARYGRADVTSEIISHPAFSLDHSGPDFVLVQPGRSFFETREVFAVVESEWTLAQSSTYRGVMASSVYVRTAEGSETGCGTPADEKADR